MYAPHPNCELNDLFAQKAYQGAEPDQAAFLFVGLDANYAPDIGGHAIFPEILAYHSDGVAFWQRHGVHHPFQLPGYTGDGRFYHQSFARIGFDPGHAHLVSFIELLHVPTVGRSKLVPGDLSLSHLKRLNTLMLDGPAQHIFLPSGVARLMRATGEFRWLADRPSQGSEPLATWWRAGGKTAYTHLHFSVYGMYAERKAREAVAIRRLLPH